MAKPTVINRTGALRRFATTVRKKAGVIGLAAALTLPAGILGVRESLQHHRFNQTKLLTTVQKETIRQATYQQPVLQQLLEVCTPKDREKIEGAIYSVIERQRRENYDFYEKMGREMAKRNNRSGDELSRTLEAGQNYADYVTDMQTQNLGAQGTYSTILNGLSGNREEKIVRELFDKYRFSPGSTTFEKAYMNRLEQKQRELERSGVIKSGLITAGKTQAVVIPTLLAIALGIKGYRRFREKRFLKYGNVEQRRPWDLNQVKERLDALNEKWRKTPKKMTNRDFKEIYRLKKIIQFELTGRTKEKK